VTLLSHHLRRELRSNRSMTARQRRASLLLLEPQEPLLR
jgi:hypothetical protein